MGSPILLFDGACNLCNAAVRFILERDRRREIRFGPLKSRAGERILREYDRNPATESLVLIEAGRVFLRSTAVLRVARHLRWPWSWFYGFVIVPRFIRDFLYDRVARRRYRWFGHRDDACPVPPAEWRERFLEE